MPDQRSHRESSFCISFSEPFSISELMIRNYQKLSREIFLCMSFPRHQPGTVKHVVSAGFFLDIF